jgi:hypothetical protein
VHPLLIALAAAPAPTPTPSLRPGLDQDQVTPGLLGFLLTAFIVVLTALLIVDMVRRIRRVRYRAQVEEERAEPEAAARGLAGNNDAGDKNAGNNDAGDTNAGNQAGLLRSGGLDGGHGHAGEASDIRPEANGDKGSGNR